ncbi:hypothetical protein N8935_08845 [Amylibacter sp.]|nr:hypothetical protein [Amylibacter sp.]
MVLGFQEQNAIHALRFGVKMETVQALIIKSKQAKLALSDKLDVPLVDA